MKLMDFTLRAMLLTAALAPVAATTPATAATVPATTLSETALATFTGTLSVDNDVSYIRINLASAKPSLVSVETFSYAGGTMKNGHSVSRGGFDPMVSVFDSNGTLIDYNDDSYDSSARLDPITSLSADSRLDLRLRPGSYTLAVSQFFNNPDHGIQDGFSAITEDYTYSLYGCSNGRFCDVTGANRTSDYALQVSVAPVPVPAALPLLGSAIGILGVLGFGRRRRAQA